MRFTLKLARTDRTFGVHKFSDLKVAFAFLNALQTTGTVRYAWVYDRLQSDAKIYSYKA